MLHHALRACSGSIQYIGNTTGIISPSSNTFSIDYPNGTADGDLAILGLCATSNLGVDFTSTGWTKIDRQIGQTGVKSQLSRTIVSGTSSQTFTRSGALNVPQNPSYILLVFRNCSYSSYGFASNSTGSPDAPTLNGTFNCVLAFGFTAASDAAIDPPSGYVLANNIENVASMMAAFLINTQTNPYPSNFQNVTSGAWNAYSVGLI